MEKLYYDKNKIVNKVLPSLEKTLVKVNEVDRVCNNVYIPNDFNYYNSLNRIFNGIDNIKKDLIDVNSWLESSNKKIDKCLNELNEMFNNMEPIDFEVRKNMIL